MHGRREGNPYIVGKPYRRCRLPLKIFFPHQSCCVYTPAHEDSTVYYHKKISSYAHIYIMGGGTLIYIYYYYIN